VTQCFRDSQRLLSAADYRKVFQGTEHKAGQKEVLLLARNSDHPRHRLGLAIAKKHVPTAVKRNLIKRLTRECFRKLDKKSPSMDVVVLSRPGANTASRIELRKALQKQFARLGLSPG
jgi:ribonuclease P protein component